MANFINYTIINSLCEVEDLALDSAAKASLIDSQVIWLVAMKKEQGA